MAIQTRKDKIYCFELNCENRNEYIKLSMKMFKEMFVIILYILVEVICDVK